ncbi:MAG: hypothetical protein ABUS57_03235 [Pseudomonadota bacterium]
MKDGWVRPAVWISACVAFIAAAYPAGWIIQNQTGADLVPDGPYAILAVFALSVVSVAALVLTFAVAMLGASRREDRAKSELQSFE